MALTRGHQLWGWGGSAQSPCHSTGTAWTPSVFPICAGLLPGAILGTPLHAVAVFGVLVPFCRGLRGTQSGLFAVSFPGPSHQCGDPEHPMFPWLTTATENSCLRCAFPSSPEGPPAPASAVPPPWQPGQSAPVSLHPWYSRAFFLF